jgi:hypothetical protein
VQYRDVAGLRAKAQTVTVYGTLRDPAAARTAPAPASAEGSPIPHSPTELFVEPHCTRSARLKSRWQQVGPLALRHVTGTAPTPRLSPGCDHRGETVQRPAPHLMAGLGVTLSTAVKLTRSTRRRSPRAVSREGTQTAPIARQGPRARGPPTGAVSRAAVGHAHPIKQRAALAAARPLPRVGDHE